MRSSARQRYTPASAGSSWNSQHALEQPRASGEVVREQNATGRMVVSAVLHDVLLGPGRLGDLPEPRGAGQPRPVSGGADPRQQLFGVGDADGLADARAT